MSMTLIYGEAGTGKSEYCIASMLELFKQKIPSIMIVPEQFAHSAEARLIEKNGFLSDDIQSVSFKRLAVKQLKKNGMLGKSISNIGKSMVLSKAILQSSSLLSLYKHSAEKPGFVDSMLTLISECKRSEITPQMLSVVTEEEDPYLALKLKDLSIIYEAYQKALDTEYTDTEDYLRLFADCIRKNTSFNNTPIFIDEFFRFTPAEMDCIQALLECGAHVSITLGALPDAAGIFQPVTDTARQLISLAKRAGASVHAPVILTEKFRFAASEELAHFEKEYHHYPPAEYPKETEHISLYVAPDLYTETQILAASIRKDISRLGLHYRDIAVICGNPDLYQDLIKTVFPVYGIPVFIDRKYSLLSHPIIIMLLSLFEMMAHGIETESLMAYIKTGYSDISADESDILENFALAGRLRRQDWMDDHRFLQRADSVFYETEEVSEKNRQEAEKLLELRNRVLAPLLALRSDLADDKTVRSRAEALFRYFEAIDLYHKVEREIEDFKIQGDLQAAQEYSEVYNLLMTLLDELVFALGDEKIGMKRLEIILTAGLSQCEISTIPPGNDQVFIGDTGRSLVKNVKALYVIGANADSFPAAPAQEGLIKDSERNQLEKKGLCLGPDGNKISFQNQYLVYSALNISCRTMTVSYAVADFDGKGMQPSPLIARLKKLFPCLSVSDNLLTPPGPEQIIAGKPSAWQYLLEHFRDDSAQVAELKALFSKDPDYADKLNAMMHFSQYTHQVSELSPDIARKLYGTTLKTSITRLESYAKCPFSYFMQYGLRAKERKVLKIDAPDIGHLLHKLVELASRQLVDENRSFASLSEADCRAIAEKTTNELLPTLFISHLYAEKRLSALTKRLKNQLAKMLEMIVAHVTKGEFEPCAFEVAFDENGEFPPVKINLPTGESITLTGRIDRIDALEQNGEVYIKVIDYKTGTKNFRLSDVYNRLSLQLAVYITAITESRSELFPGGAKPAGMFYFRLADKTVDAAEQNTKEAMLKQFKMSGMVLRDVDIIRAMDTGIKGSSAIVPAYLKQDGTLSESSGCYATYEQFKKLSAYIRRIAGELGQEILHGAVSVSPCKTNKQFPCRYCRFHSICLFNPETDSYRTASPLKDDAVWDLIEKSEK